MRIIFAGSPEAAVPSLDLLHKSNDIEVAAVLTKPDSYTGRGRKTKKISEIASYAEENSIPVYKFESLKDPEVLKILNDLNVDCCAVVAYGKLIPKNLLNIFKYGWINLHFSLLPNWRGAAPVQAAINAGDSITGVSTFVIEEGLDTGKILGTLTENIRKIDTNDTLLNRLSVNGSVLLYQTLQALTENKIHAIEQPVEGVSYAPKIESSNSRINWNSHDYQIDRLIRSRFSQPCSWTMLDELRFKIGPVIESEFKSENPPGTIIVKQNKVYVCTVDKDLELNLIQPSGKSWMQASSWIRGIKDINDLKFT